MSKRKPKIEIPTGEEIKKFGGSTTGTAGRDKDPAPEPATAGSDETAVGACKPEPQPSPQDELDALRRELEEQKDKLVRAKADYQNLLRRTAVEKSEAIRFANEGFVKSLLPVVDDFERTLQAAEQAGSADPVVEGVRLIYDNLLKVLRDHQVSVIEAKGRPLDPRLHNVAMQEPSDECEPGTVTRELQRGYRLHDRVIRPARVVLAAAPAGEESESPPSAKQEEN